MALRAIDSQLDAGEPAAYSRAYVESYMAWFHALYKDKYFYLGDLDMMWAAFLLDIGCYYLGPVYHVYKHPDSEYRQLPYNGPVGARVATFMAFYNRRLSHLARRRLAAGVYGKNNLDNRRLICQGFSIDRKLMRLIRIGLTGWLRLEWENLWLRPKPGTSPAPAPAMPAMETA
jgi:hypothetical protein